MNASLVPREILSTSAFLQENGSQHFIFPKDTDGTNHSKKVKEDDILALLECTKGPC
jgi:hypothetical protein